MNREHTTSEMNGFTSGLFIGGLLGAVTAFWLAPQSGKKTQTMIRRRAHQLQHKAESVGQDIQSGAQHASVEIREKVAKVQSNPVEPVKR
jgi:gas vesicle protein